MSAIPDAPDNSRQKVYTTFVLGQLNDVTNAKLSFMQCTYSKVLQTQVHCVLEKV